VWLSSPLVIRHLLKAWTHCGLFFHLEPHSSSQRTRVLSLQSIPPCQSLGRWRTGRRGKRDALRASRGPSLRTSRFQGPY
jgi:hypothetical protein